MAQIALGEGFYTVASVTVGRRFLMTQFSNYLAEQLWMYIFFGFILLMEI